MKDFEPGDEQDEENFPAPTRPNFQPFGRSERAAFLRQPATRTGPPGAVSIEIPDFKSGSPSPKVSTGVGVEDREALQIWKGVQNLDRFLEQVYQYYHGKGLRIILLNRVSNLLMTGFVVVLSLFLRYCIKWDFLWKPATETEHPKLIDVIALSGLFRMSFFMYICTISFMTIWTWQAWLLMQNVPRLKTMRRFYRSVLMISEDELPTYDFNDIVNKLVYLQSIHPVVPGSIDACEIANRIMRRENYLIALFNKEIIDFTVPVPFIQKHMLTKTLEWNLSFAILTYIFDENLVVKSAFLKENTQGNMINGLQKRFQILALINLALSPFIFVFLLIYFVFRYGEEAYKNPSILGDRQYTQYARWKLREFNELPHLFDRRLELSYKKANRYMEQFHSEKLASIGKFVAFVAGSLCVVLIAVTVVNEDLLLHFEITPGKSIIWYLAFFGAVLAITRALVPDPVRFKDPSKLMIEVQEYTHYTPKHWTGKLQTEMVRGEFSELYQYQVINFAQELMSIFWTPYVLWFSLAPKSQAIVEFFREFTVHVDKLGYVCSFALFDFKRHGDPKFGSITANTGKYYRSKQGKMEKSFLNFTKNYPNWTPNDQGSMYISKLKDFVGNQSTLAGSRLFNAPASDDSELNLDNNVGLMALLNEYYEYRQRHTAA